MNFINNRAFEGPINSKHEDVNIFHYKLGMVLLGGFLDVLKIGLGIAIELRGCEVKALRGLHGIEFFFKPLEQLEGGSFKDIPFPILVKKIR